MGGTTEVSQHYGRGGLLDRLRAALIDDGADPDRPTIAALAPYDQFHGRGLEATEELAGHLEVAATDHLVDVGCGIGGPARYFADRFGCRITGIDLTDEFCAAARHLSHAMGLADRLTFEQGDALAMPFADSAFDGAYSMNVSMNIADKEGLYREIHRVLRPGAWLALSELTLGPGEALDYPTPWARTAATSFLATGAETRTRLEAAGFQIESARDATEASLDYGARARAMIERGEKPPHRAVALIHGDIASEMLANTARGVAEKRVIPMEILCTKHG